MSEPVLELKDLHTHFFTDSGEIPAVDGVSIKVHEGEVVGIVGESGSGKKCNFAVCDAAYPKTARGNCQRRD